MNAKLARKFGLGLVPLRELQFLRRGQHGQARNFLFGIGHNGFQHGLEVSRHARHGARVK